MTEHLNTPICYLYKIHTPIHTPIYAIYTKYMYNTTISNKPQDLDKFVPFYFHSV